MQPSLRRRSAPAAGIVLVREAGGFVSDLNGGETYMDTGDIIATNPKLLKLMVQSLKS